MTSSRKERRAAAKKMGLLSQNATYKEFAERLKRSNEAGEMIHRSNLEQQRWESKKQEEKIKSDRLISEINSSQKSNREETFTLNPTSFEFLQTTNSDEDQPQ